MPNTATDMRASRRTRRIQKRQNEILDAAKEVFLGREFSAVTMEEIADRAVMTRTTVYQYFRNKTELYGSVVLRDMETLAGSMIAAFDERQDMASNLKAVAKAYFAFFATNSFYFKKFSFFFLPGREAPMPEEVSKQIDTILAEAVAVIEQCLKLGLKRGECRRIDTRSVALAMWAQWMGCAYQAITNHTPRFGRNLEQVYMAGMDIALRGLVQPEEATKAAASSATRKR
jgi:AcrR family transcriptional regulator